MRKNVGGWCNYKYDGCDPTIINRDLEYKYRSPSFEQCHKKHFDKAENDVVQDMIQLMVR